MTLAKNKILLFIFIGILCLVISKSGFSQAIYDVMSIDQDLLENAHTVVRLETKKITVEHQSNFVETNKKVVTTLKQDDDQIRLFVWYNKSRKIKKLSAKIYDKNGKLIQKIKQKDFDDVSYNHSQSLIDDSRLLIYNFTTTMFPVTTELEYTAETANTAFLPDWTLVNDFGVSVEASSYEINCPPELELRIKESLLDSIRLSKTVVGSTLKYSVTSFPAIKLEYLGPALDKLSPSVKIAINKFHLEGLYGEADSWKSFGKWYYDNLINNNDRLSESVVQEILSLCSQETDPLEKAKIVYNYVQERTRYISIQLGIGGWKPFTAKEVHELGYGDCKALTNYTKCLLGLVDVKSHYSIVYAGNNKKDIDASFVSLEGNHVILCLPISENQDTVYLECTSQTAPFGYLGNFTDDRNLLVISEDGGYITRTPKYGKENNIIGSNYNLEIKEDSINLTYEKKFGGIHYNRYRYLRLGEKKYKEMILKEFPSSLSPTVSNIVILKDEEKFVYTEKANIMISNLLQKLGENILLPLVVKPIELEIPVVERNRAHSFIIRDSEVLTDNYTYNFPEGFSVTDLPEPIIITTEFGSYRTNISMELNVLTYNRVIIFNAGEYRHDKYKDYRKFIKKIKRSENQKIVINKY